MGKPVTTAAGIEDGDELQDRAQHDALYGSSRGHTQRVMCLANGAVAAAFGDKWHTRFAQDVFWAMCVVGNRAIAREADYMEVLRHV